MIEFLSRAVLIGVGATALLDLWALLLQRFFKVPAPNWGLVGRWFCHLTKPRVLHDDIALARAYPFERAVGWVGHYAIGIAYAGALLAFSRPDWASAPTLAPALAVGIITVGAGWFLLQPGMGPDLTDHPHLRTAGEGPLWWPLSWQRYLPLKRSGRETPHDLGSQDHQPG